jgi:type VI secretion system protein ImpF
MVRADSHMPLLASLIDRLIDDDPTVSTEPAWRQSIGLRSYQASVVRDLENLLNCRQLRPELIDDGGELAVSTLTYGLPEFSSLGTGSPTERETLRRSFEDAIVRFEPRLRQVRVQLHEPSGPSDRTLKLTIDALLWVDPNPVPITFDTVV